MTDWAGRLRWYRGRARTFEPGESQWRIKDGLGRLCWAVHIPTLSAADIAARRGPSASAWPLPDLDSVSRGRLAAHGHELLAGRVVLLGWPRSDALAPNWASDGRLPGIEPPALDPAGIVSLKHIWELSRHGVLTELAAAEVLGGVNGGCAQAMNLLGQWLAAHEVPRGMPFSSGVELAMRVQHWVWLRRLVGRATPFDQASAARSFERSPVFVRSLRHHVELLQRFPSRYSSANNHRLAEASGLVVASLGFPWFRDSSERAQQALRIVEDEVALQFCPSGLHREQATGYHAFAFDLAVVAIVEAVAAGHPIREQTLHRVRDAGEVLAAMCDERREGPRFGDSDDSRVVSLDPPDGRSVVARSLALAQALGLVDAPSDITMDPLSGSDVRAAVVASFAESHGWAERIAAVTQARRAPDRVRSDMAADGGLVILEATRQGACLPESWWCAVRAGTLGYLKVRAHAHADLGAIELRIGGEPVIADPGTSGYGESPKRRTIERATAYHATLTINHAEQAEAGGPFLWLRDASASVVAFGAAAATIEVTTQSTPGVRWTRTVTLEQEGASGGLSVEDCVDSAESVSVVLTWPLHPEVQVGEYGPASFTLTLPSGRIVSAVFDTRLAWTCRRGEADGAGWYSPSYGLLEPCAVLQGRGRIEPGARLQSSFSCSSFSCTAGVDVGVPD